MPDAPGINLADSLSTGMAQSPSGSVEPGVPDVKRCDVWLQYGVNGKRKAPITWRIPCNMILQLSSTRFKTVSNVVSIHSELNMTQYSEFLFRKWGSVWNIIVKSKSTCH